MTSIITGVAVRSSDTGAAAVVDLSCGGCSSCRAEAGVWCSTPLPDGPVLVEVPAVQSESALRGLLIADAVRSAAPSREHVVLALGGDAAEAAARLVHMLHDGLVLTARDVRDAGARAALEAARPSGRADVVACDADDRAGVRAVARGGDVCIALDHRAETSVTELVQREVRLVGPRSLTLLLAALGRQAVEQALART